ncbi:Uncharacterized protein APZ42_014006 [Daphnia magna]|uniref:Uncharacterized protein n=1 Tax=Daphnia magna TaxID=35525 RepID=A0A162QD41_9CRUS|nr:Uncharacterized protein APZ42_014006 [Daphnia magna]
MDHHPLCCGDICVPLFLDGRTFWFYKIGSDKYNRWGRHVCHYPHLQQFFFCFSQLRKKMKQKKKPEEKTKENRTHVLP